MRGTEFAQLTAFATVAEHRSFTRAARQLGLSTPWVSQTIKRLEERFGVRLLNRTSRSVALTEAGRDLLARLTPAIDAVDESVEAVLSSQGRAAGTLRLSLHPLAAAALAPGVLPRFAGAFPEIRLEISVRCEPGDLVEHGFDAGVYPARLVAQDMIGLRLRNIAPLHTVASPAYLQARGAPERPEALEAHSCVTGSWGGEPGVWTFRRGDEQATVRVPSALEADDFGLAEQIALAGVGVAQLPAETATRHVGRRSLVRLLEGWESCLPELLLVHPSRRQVPGKLSCFIDAVRAAARV